MNSERTATQTGIENLPLEILVEILGFLSRDDILKVRLIWRRFYDASCAPEIASRFCIVLNRRIPKMFRMPVYRLKIFANLDIENPNTINFIENICRLKTVELRHFFVTNSILNFFLKYSPRIERFVAMCCQFSLEGSKDKFPFLKSLEIFNSPLDDLSFETLYALNPRIPKLIIKQSNLNLDQIICNRFYRAGKPHKPLSTIFTFYFLQKTLVSLAENLTSLNLLHVNNLQFSQPRLLEIIDIGFLHLKKFCISLAGANQMQIEAAWQKLPVKMPNLCSLYLFGCHLMNIKPSRMNLRCVVLSKCTVTESVLDCLRLMSNLKEVNFINADLCLNKDKAIERPSSTVTKLSLRRSRFSRDDDGIYSIIKSFPNVINLDIGETEFDSHLLRIITRNWCKLKRLYMPRVLCMAEKSLLDKGVFFPTPFGFLTDLEVLDISANKFTDTICGALNFPHLKKLFLFENITDFGILELSGRCPNLEYIYSDRYNFCTDEEMRILFPSFKKLKTSMLLMGRETWQQEDDSSQSS